MESLREFFLRQPAVGVEWESLGIHIGVSLGIIPQVLPAGDWKKWLYENCHNCIYKAIYDTIERLTKIGIIRRDDQGLFFWDMPEAKFAVDEDPEVPLLSIDKLMLKEGCTTKNPIFEFVREGERGKREHLRVTAIIDIQKEG